LVPAPRDPEGDHRRGMDRDKLKFAFWLVGSCGVLAVTLAVIDFYVDPASGANLSGIIDMLKLVATTALGFVFGRSLGKGDH